MKNETLHEEEASGLKRKQRGKIIGEKLSVFIFAISILIIMLYLLGPYVIAGFILAIFLFYPYPLIPNRYKITESTIICNEKRVIPVQKLSPRRHKLKLNEGDNYVSIHHRLRGEFIRLYTSRPKKVYNILIRLMQSSNGHQSLTTYNQIKMEG